MDRIGGKIMKAVKKMISLGILTAFIMMIMTGCGASDTQNSAELNFQLSNSPSTIDAQEVADTNSSMVVKFFTSTLYEYNSNRELVPGLAESYDVSSDGLTVTYHLKDDLKWSNAKPLTADDFVCAFQRIADPATKSSAIYLITDCCMIANSAKISIGELPVSELGVSAPDKKTFVIKLEQPCPYINSLISLTCFSPCSREFFNSCSGSYASSADTMLSCGAYVMDRYEPLASQIHLSPNKYYYKGNNITSGVNLQVVGDAQQAMMCYETGMLDVIRITGELADLAKDDTHLKAFSTAQIYRLDINHSTNKTLKNLNIRKALAKSIDRQSIAANVIRSGYSALERVVPEKFYTQTDGKDFAADQKQYEDQMGYDTSAAANYWSKGLKELGTDSAELEFVYASSQSKVAEPIAKQLEDNLKGLKLKLTPLPDKEWLRRINLGDQYDIILASWVPDFVDPTALFTTCLGTGNNNLYFNEQFNELYNKSQSLSGAQRDEILHQLESIILDDAALIPLFNGEQRYLVADGVSGLQVTPTGVEIVISGLRKERK